MAKHDLRRIVTFHSRIDHATRFAFSLPATSAWLPARRRPSGDLWTDHVSGKMTAGERDARLRRLSGVGADERGVLTNARCLTEGVDVPTLDAVAFIDPRRSQVDVVQAVGRAIRKAEDKALGYIIIPVLVGANSDPGEAVEASEFDRVWEVLRGLRDHDDALADELDALRREQGRRGSVSERPRKIVLDLPVRIGRGFASAFDARLVETTTRVWEFWFGLLEAYVIREGTSRIEKDHVEAEYRLGQWVAQQRAFHARDVLAEERAERLASLPGWVWNVRRNIWEGNFALLCQFVERHGHAGVQRNHIEDGYPLGRWAQSQRSRYHENDLSPERVTRFEQLPGWVWHSHDAAWEQNFKLLTRFVQREGHALVPSDHLEGGAGLGNWVVKQRVLHKRGQLEPDLAERLAASPGWAWNSREAWWERGYLYLSRFAEREGHASPSGSHREDGFRLGGWVSAQRIARATMAPERRRRLEGLPGWTWAPLSQAWERAFKALLDFLAREGHARVPGYHVEDGYHLGAWVRTQGRAHHRGELPEAVHDRLAALQGWQWDTSAAEAWESGFRHLQRYIERKGTAAVPPSYIESDGYRLGSWCAMQKQKRTRGDLPGDRALRLEALPGWKWARNSATHWEEHFALLKRFVEREGHANVPQRHVESEMALGIWVSRQRLRRAKGKLKVDRAERLQALPGWTWNAREAAAGLTRPARTSRSQRYRGEPATT